MGTYLGFPIIVPPGEVQKMGDGRCFQPVTVCTDTLNCTETHTYYCPPGCCNKGHIPKFESIPVFPCPPEAEIPPPRPDAPRTVKDCEDRDKVSYVVIDGQRTARTVIQANAPECIPDNPPREGLDPFVAGVTRKVWGTDTNDDPNWRETVLFEGGQNIDIEYVGTTPAGIKRYRINYVPY
jgi:hypothetical protein